MKFKRDERHVAPGLSAKKVAAMKQRLKREQAKYPLFPEQIAEQQAPIDVAAEERLRQRRFETSQQSMRDLHARQWRRARAKYFAATLEQRRAILVEWNGAGYPKEAAYFASVVDKHNGDLDRRLAEARAQTRAIVAQIRQDMNRQRGLSIDGATL